MSAGVRVSVSVSVGVGVRQRLRPPHTRDAACTVVQGDCGELWTHIDGRHQAEHLDPRDRVSSKEEDVCTPASTAQRPAETFFVWIVRQLLNLLRKEPDGREEEWVESCLGGPSWRGIGHGHHRCRRAPEPL